jgi:hypothetical protein
VCTVSAYPAAYDTEASATSSCAAPSLRRGRSGHRIAHDELAEVRLDSGHEAWIHSVFTLRVLAQVSKQIQRRSGPISASPAVGFSSTGTSTHKTDYRRKSTWRPIYRVPRAPLPGPAVAAPALGPGYGLASAIAQLVDRLWLGSVLDAVTHTPVLRRIAVAAADTAVRPGVPANR